MERSNYEEPGSQSGSIVENLPAGSEHWIVHTSKATVEGTTVHCVASQSSFSRPDFGYPYERSQAGELLLGLGITQLHDIKAAHSVEQTLFQFTMASRDLVDDPHGVMAFILDVFPVPVFGSPPATWRSLSQTLATAGSGIAGNGVALSESRPIFAVATNLGLFIYWYGRPTARVTRRWLTELIARKLEVSLQEDDYA